MKMCLVIEQIEDTTFYDHIIMGMVKEKRIFDIAV